MDWAAFTRGYLRRPVRFLFLSILRCFSSRRSPLREAIAWGFPFGHPEFFASVRLPRAFRSLARPSSALEPSHPPGGTVATQVGLRCRSRQFVRYESSRFFIRLGETSPVNVWNARTHGLIRTPSGLPWTASTLPTRGRPVWCIGLFVPATTDGFEVPKPIGAADTRHGPTGIRTQGILLAKEALYH